MNRDFFIKLFWPILRFFEKGGSATGYKPSHRKILFAVGFLFFVLFCVSTFFALISASFGAFIPVVVFFAISLVCAVVAVLGSDSAVARIWGND